MTYQDRENDVLKSPAGIARKITDSLPESSDSVVLVGPGIEGENTTVQAISIGNQRGMTVEEVAERARLDRRP